MDAGVSTTPAPQERHLFTCIWVTLSRSASGSSSWSLCCIFILTWNREKILKWQHCSSCSLFLWLIWLWSAENLRDYHPYIHTKSLLALKLNLFHADIYWLPFRSQVHFPGVSVVYQLRTRTNCSLRLQLPCDTCRSVDKSMKLYQRVGNM